MNNTTTAANTAADTAIAYAQATPRWVQTAQAAALTRLEDPEGWRDALRALKAEGAPMALLGAVTGLSRQRIFQITTGQ